MSKIVCFTGHRIIPEALYTKLNHSLYQEVERQIQQGATEFRTGGALGFDTMAALNVLLLRQTHPQIRLELCLPYPSQPDDWSQENRLLYQQILEQADRHRYISKSYHPGALQMRNRAMIEGAQVCIAFLHRSGGGTAFTSALALRNGLEFINLNDLL